ncbi:MAG: energy transducer TonB [Acidobacteriia bacterium]|nr:energy transducer TonB [Terriglobia bacterium]
MRILKSQSLSFILHVVSLGILLFLTSRSIAPPKPATTARDAVPLVLPMQLVVHAGGSNQTELPARHGSPPPTARRTFIPPVSRPDPKLAMPITAAFDSPTIVIDAEAIGDPSSKLLAGALGRDGHNGIGVGCCAGIGPGTSGRPGISSSSSRGRITPPQLIYKVEPEFSEEARKAKYQGMVVLAIDVDASGRAINFRILRGLGLGLDEKAIEAVSRWRFRPGLLDGKPTTTSATVEVSFHLL